MAGTFTIEREITVSVREKITTSREGAVEDKPSEDILWSAVAAKDRRYDGIFWFAVKTTGIYCRPSCASRQPLRENVTFYEAPETAQKEGFRACKRCRPDQLPFPDPATDLVQKICSFIAISITENPDDSLSLDVLANKFSLSAAHVQRTFSATLGISPKEYADAFRMAHFKRLVKSSTSVTEAMHEAGYGSSSRLYEKAGAMLGMTPASYKRNGKGAVMYVEVAECRLGYVLVAGTDKGLCAVELAGDPGIGREYMGDMEEATFRAQKPPQFWDWYNAILAYIEEMSPARFDALLRLPYDVRMTAFQASVWSLLRAIPCGETRSYSEIAEALGDPKAQRAVASACASNPIALVTPCHRVVRQGGDISGYRWGVERKRKILEAEARQK